ncbi:MAG TPA: putative glycoside hydrolase [Solirubrobacterales bacterium]
MLPAPLHAATPGQVNLVRNATSEFDSFTSGATPAQRIWMDSHYSSMRGYAPYFNQALGWAPPTDFYSDLYAIYREGSGTPNHDNWILKDSSGHDLYIPAACNGSYCTQYAGDVGNPEFRRYWIAEAERSLVKGYHGIFIDDVNMTITVSNASGDGVDPIDPRTGRPMTEENWRRYVAEFCEEIRAAMPEVELVHNTPWYENQNDPYVRREIASANAIELERGFTDPGLTGGGGTFGFSTLLAHVEWLHSLGKSVMFEPYIENEAQREYNLAGYFLVNNSTDSLVTSYETNPGAYWQGWETNLGAALGPRYEWHGLIRRDFETGMVLLAPPGAATTTVALGGQYTEAGGAKVNIVQLGGRQAVVLRSPLAPTPERGSEPPTGSEEGNSGTSGPIGGEAPTVIAESLPAPSEPVMESSGSAAPTETTASSQTVTLSVPQPAGTASAAEAEAVGAATVSGAVVNGTRVRVALKILTWHRGAWTAARSVLVTAGRSGAFHKRIQRLDKGRYLVSAEANGHAVRLDNRRFSVS